MIKRHKKRLEKIFLCIITFTFFTFNMFFTIGNAEIKTSNNKINLGELSHYNGIVFNNVEAKDSRIEGALAVGGNLNIVSGGQKTFEVCSSESKGAEAGSSLVGGNYNNDGPSLLLGGNIKQEAGKKLLVWSEPLITSNLINNETKNILSNLGASNKLQSINNNDIKEKFNKFKEKTNNFIDNVKKLNKNSGSVANLQYHGDSPSNQYYKYSEIKSVLNTKNKDDIKALYCNLEGNKDNILNVSEIHLPDNIGSAKNNEVKYLVIYSDATKVNLSGGGYYYNQNYLCNKSDEENNMITFHRNNKTLEKLSEKIVWVLPNAKTIKTDGSVIGSIVAPNATLNTNGGDLVGQVIVNNFNQESGGNFCNYIFNWDEWTNVIENNNETEADTDKENSSDLLNISKTADYYHEGDKTQQLNDREYTITLNASVKKDTLDYEKPKDVILVLDTSGSMRGDPANSLISSAQNFSTKLLSNSKNKISVITFAGSNTYITDIRKHNNYYTGYVNYYGNKDSKITIFKHHRHDGIYNGYINYGTGNQIKVKVDARYGWDRARILSGIPNDEEVLSDFTSDSKALNNKLNGLKSKFGGGTDAQAAMEKIGDQLNEVKNDAQAEKYVIFFTDGKPNMAITTNSQYTKDCIKATIETFKQLKSENKNTKFISLGFKSETLESNDKNSREFLKSIQDYNNEIEPSAEDSVIYIDKPDEIEGIYNKIYNKITMNVQDAKIIDKVPDNFEIVKGSEYPKGAIINGNTITWINQTIDTNKIKFTFMVKAKDSYFGNTTNDTDYMNQKGEVNTNTEAIIQYTNPQNNKQIIQKFEVPTVNVPNSYTLNLQNKAVLYGDRVKLSDLIKNINIKYGPQDGYVYTWTDDKEHKIVLDNQNKNELSGNNFDKNSKEQGIVMKDDTKYTLEITNKNIPNFVIKSSGQVNVIKPKIQITKKVVDNKGNEINSDGLFSFNISQTYNGDVPVSISKQTWNLDIKNNNQFTIKNVVRGIYSFNERDYQEYKFKGLKINGREINQNNCKFILDQKDNKFTLNGEVIESKEPMINIEVTDSVNDIKFSNSSTVIQNNFDSLN